MTGNWGSCNLEGVCEWEQAPQRIPGFTNALHKQEDQFYIISTSTKDRQEGWTEMLTWLWHETSCLIVGSPYFVNDPTASVLDWGH